MTLARPLDRESLPEFTVVIVASDQGPGFNSDNVCIIFSDININLKAVVGILLLVRVWLVIARVIVSAITVAASIILYEE